MRILTVALAVAFLASCAGPSPEEIAAMDHADCVSLGYTPRTEGYSNCRLAMWQMEQQRMANAIAGWQASGMAGDSVRNSFERGY